MDHNRWNIQVLDGRTFICYGEHEKSEGCDWVEYVTKDALERLKELLTKIEAYADHSGPCRYDVGPAICDCGLSDLQQEIYAIQ